MISPRFLTGDLSKKLRDFVQDRSGLAFLEFVMIVPFLTFLLMGGVELTLYVLLHNKMIRVASTSADLTTRAPEITDKDLEQILDASTLVAEPFNMAGQGTLIITSVSSTTPPNSNQTEVTVRWQTSTISAGKPHKSKVGKPASQDPKLPNGYEMPPNGNVIVTEVFYDYEPILFGAVTENSTLYYTAVNYPRQGPLTEITPAP